MTNLSKPKIFIGSSTEGRHVADAFVQALDYDAEPTAWPDGVFELGQSYLHSLMKARDEFDCAIIILTADDMITKKGIKGWAPRDNAIFELGFFMGAYGNERTFIVHERENPPMLPSDLAGIRAASFSPRENMKSAVRSAAIEIMTALKKCSFEANIVKSKPLTVPKVYWAAPHGNTKRNDRAASKLKASGIDVLLPEHIVNSKLNSTNSKRGRTFPARIRSACIEAIHASDYLVVDVDTYGMDTAWEIGYADALKIPVLGVNFDRHNICDKRTVNRKLYADNFMHGWTNKNVFRTMSKIIQECEKKSVYVCGSFRNIKAIKALRDSALKDNVSELIIPKDELQPPKGLPQNYPWDMKVKAIELLENADIALVILPRYGMDTSWQIGYATALGKRIIGWKTAAFGPETEEAIIWDHWMHAWREKLCLKSVSELCAYISGTNFHGCVERMRVLRKI
jgi:nucleoside 2-deoxyribosyltransferase